MAQETVLQTSAAGFEPEKIVVLETRDRWVDFARAVQDIDGIGIPGPLGVRGRNSDNNLIEKKLG